MNVNVEAKSSGFSSVRPSIVLAIVALVIALAGPAEAIRFLELPLGTRVELPVHGLERAMADDPGVVEVETDLTRGIVILTGVGFAHESVVYAWTAEALPLVIGVKVVEPLPVPIPERPWGTFLADGHASLYRFSVGSGARINKEGARRLPFFLTGSGQLPIGDNRVTFRGLARPSLGETEPPATAAGAVEWATDRYRFMVGDRSLELSPHLLSSFPLRGVAIGGGFGTVQGEIFGGVRSSAEFRLLPKDDERMDIALGGARVSWAASESLRFSGVAAAGPKSSLLGLGVSHTRGPVTLGLDGATTFERQAVVASLRYESARLDLTERLTLRTFGESPLLPGADGLTSEHIVTVRPRHDLSLTGRLIVLAPTPRNGWDGAWHAGGAWTAGDRLAFGLGVDRSFDGTSASAGGTIRTRLGAETRIDAGVSHHWLPVGRIVTQQARLDHPLLLPPINRLFIEEALTHRATVGGIDGSLKLAAGVEARAGWLSASLAPGVVVPTLTAESAIAPMLTLRLGVTPHAAITVHGEVSQRFGREPETMFKIAVSPALGQAVQGSWLGDRLFKSSLHGRVFIDRNGNGRADEGEPGLADARVIVGDKTAVTDKDGRYRITGLRGGDHTITVDRGSLDAALRFATRSSTTVLLPRDRKQPVDFALVGTGTIQGVLFNDVDQTGSFTGTEPGIAGEVVVEGPGIERRLSASGPFTFGGLEPGRYRLSLDAGTLPPGHVPRQASAIEIDLAPGEIAVARFPVQALRALRVLICHGRSADNVCTADDAPAAGIVVTAGNRSAIADSAGRVLFRDLPAGDLTISVKEASLPAGTRAPAPITVTLPSTPTTQPLTIKISPAR